MEPLSRTHSRWKKALGGKAVSRNGEVITVESWEILAKVLSAPRLEILARIPVLLMGTFTSLEMARDFGLHTDIFVACAKRRPKPGKLKSPLDLTP